MSYLSNFILITPMDKKEYDIIVVWWWILWLSCAYSLSDQNLKIALIDQHWLGNKLQASHDYTRNFRVEYWGNQDMEDLALYAKKLREKFEQKEGKRFLKNTGSLYLWNHRSEYSNEAYAQMKARWHPVTWVPQDQLKKKYNIHNISYAFLDHTGWILDAASIIDTLTKHLLTQHNIDIITDKIITYSSSSLTSSSQMYTFKKAILCPWSRHNTLHQLPEKTIPEKQVSVNFSCKNMERYRQLPMFIYPESWFYWWPVATQGTMKIVTHASGDIHSDLEGERNPTEQQKTDAQVFIEQLFPHEERVIDSASSCFYNMTKDKNFLIDRIDENIYLASWGSGHAFKFWLVIGEYMSNQVLWITHPYEALFQQQFSLSRLSLN